MTALNPVLYQLYMIPTFRKGIMGLPEAEFHDTDKANNLPYQLKVFTYSSFPLYNPQIYRKFLKNMTKISSQISNPSATLSKIGKETPLTLSRL